MGSAVAGTNPAPAVLVKKPANAALRKNESTMPENKDAAITMKGSEPLENSIVANSHQIFYQQYLNKEVRSK